MDILVTLSVVVFFGAILAIALKKSSSPSNRRQCPNCGEPLPTVRKPTNTRQMMWGGWTCTRCDAELDRSSKIIKAGRPASAVLSGGLDQVDHAQEQEQGALTESTTPGALGLHHENTGVTLDLEESEQRTTSAPSTTI